MMRICSHLVLCIVLLVLLCVTASAQAPVRAWLDRSSATPGQEVTLNLEVEGDGDVPDTTPLQADFTVVASSKKILVQMVNGHVSSTVKLSIILQPRHAGELQVPPLRMGRATTPALSLRVVDASAAQPSNSGVFIQTEVDDQHPYAQQTVGVTVRLLIDLPLISGQLDLDAPDGAALQRVGDDAQSQREVGGRIYTVIERHFQLVPDRSGPLQLPAPHFSGVAATGGGFAASMGPGGRRVLSVFGSPVSLQVRTLPANASQPWLPLHGLRLSYAQLPRDLVAGQAAAMVVEVIAHGATRAQVPALPTPSVAGAQVFAEPPDVQENLQGSTPVVRILRRYDILAHSAGALKLPGMGMDWFDVGSGQVRTARLPDLDLLVAPASSATVVAAPPAPPVQQAPAPASFGPIFAPAGQAASTRKRVGMWAAGPASGWRILALVVTGVGLLFFFSRWWPLKRTPARRGCGGESMATLAVLLSPLAGWLLSRREPARVPWRGLLSRRTPVSTAAVAEPPSLLPRAHDLANLPGLRRVLDTGTLDEMADTLRSMAPVSTPDMDVVVASLAEPAQRDAVQALRRARWAGGDGFRAREQMRQAFAHGPIWNIPDSNDPIASQLPPLYPR